MNAVFDAAVLRTLVKRVWCFAYRLTEDEPLAESMVAHACDTELKASNGRSERDTFVRMLAAAHAAFSRNGNMAAPDSRSHCETKPRHPAAAGRNWRSRTRRMHARILFEFRSLASHERALLLLVEVEGLTYEESASVLDVSVDGARLAHVALRLKVGRAITTRNAHGLRPA
ncbi:hypothetical protein GCM10027093_36520 [Paraburkholderia jirisanensis]